MRFQPVKTVLGRVCGGDGQVSLAVKVKETRILAYNRLSEGERNQFYAVDKTLDPTSRGGADQRR